MAYVDNSKLQDPNQQNQAQGQAQQAQPGSQSSGGGDVVGGAGGANGTASSQPSSSSGSQSGTGGVGNGWTNIQAYMNANQQNTGSADLLNNTVGSQFNQEKQNIADQSSQLKNQAKSQVDSVNQAQSGAAQMIQDAGQNYSWSGQRNSNYGNDVSTIKNAITGQYQGPTSYNYSLSDQTQKYGQDLGDDNAFRQYMGDMYQQMAGGPLNDGSRALQTQLDVSNQPLNQTRQNLKSQYAGLGDYRNQVASDTNSVLNQSATDFTNAQMNLKNYLGGQADTLSQKVDNEQAKARTDYQNEYNTGLSGDGNPYYGMSFPSNTPSWWNTPNLTWSQLQSEKDYGDSAPLHNYGSYTNGLPVWDTANAQYAKSLSDLNNFYSTEDQKYANTGDPEKAEWNAIQEMLGNTDRKTQGFKVRG